MSTVLSEKDQLRAEIAELRSERDDCHRTLLNREESLKRQSEEWVKAKTEADALRGQVQVLQQVLQQALEPDRREI